MQQVSSRSLQGTAAPHVGCRGSHQGHHRWIQAAQAGPCVACQTVLRSIADAQQQAQKRTSHADTSATSMMASFASKCTALPLLLLAFAGVAYGQGYVRDLHHFKLAPGVKAADAAAALKTLCAAAPRGQVLSCQVGADLGLAGTLYPATAAANPNPEAAATIDFPSATEAAAFWRRVGADARFVSLARGIAANPRLQYRVTAGTPTNSATVRHSFQYTSYKDPKAANAKASSDILAYICKSMPVKAVACTYGPDLAMPLGAATDSPFGGVIDFATVADMRAYWRWLLADKPFAAFNKEYGPKASRIQYNTAVPVALVLPAKPMAAAVPKVGAGRRM